MCISRTSDLIFCRPHFSLMTNGLIFPRQRRISPRTHCSIVSKLTPTPDSSCDHVRRTHQLGRPSSTTIREKRPSEHCVHFDLHPVRANYPSTLVSIRTTPCAPQTCHQQVHYSRCHSIGTG